MRYAIMTVMVGFAWPGIGLASQNMAGADVVILGEVHDNPAHHAVQAELVARLNPKAIVFEMLDADQATQITDENRSDEGKLRTVLGWDKTGWPDFSLYHPIFEAAPSAWIVGAGLPRDAARGAMKVGVVAYFGAEAGSFGLDTPLDEDEQAARQTYQAEAHCGALPDEMLSTMVELQRLRDALLARQVVAAFDGGGGPIVVITGNGHARKDWGLVRYLKQARPDLNVFALGQSEAGQIEGVFDEIRDAPAVERPDPCLEFQKQG